LIPNTRPHTPFKNGICQACTNFDSRKNINWTKRLKELKKICNKYKKKDGQYDCVLPVSGGKDSHSMVHWVKNICGLNPLLVTTGDPFTKTLAGQKNYFNLGDTFDCDQYLGTVSPKLVKKLTRYTFEKTLDPLLFVEEVLNSIAFKLAIQYDIKLMFKGESPFIYGASKIENKSALERTIKRIENLNIDFWKKAGARKDQLNSINLPINKIKQKKIDINIFYLSYFVPWSSVTNKNIAEKYGFSDLSHEWIREGCAENFEQIDSVAYLTHLWLKYPKFGFQRTTDIVSRRIREGNLSLTEGKKIISEKDHKLDQKALDDFCETLGYSKKEFWKIVDKFWNKNIFKRKYNFWEMKVDRFKSS
jgi:N-acetyl sugar amidotransferase